MQPKHSMQPTIAGRAQAQVKREAFEFLSFRLGQEEYGIDILKVQEIRSYEQPTRMANSPEFIKGVVNLRGNMVPIIDMRLKLNLASADFNEFTVVIILTVASQVLGIVVDAVSDVITVLREQIKPAPDCSGQMDTSHLIGLAPLGERTLILMDIDKLIGKPEVELLGDVLSTETQEASSAALAHA